MAIRLWPQDYERKDHITKAEKGILRYAARNFQNGHMVVGIDPVRSCCLQKTFLRFSAPSSVPAFSLVLSDSSDILLFSFSEAQHIRCSVLLPSEVFFSPAS